MSENVLEVNHLKKWFPIEKGVAKKHIGDVRAVDDVSFFIKKGETLGLVGESGCGKTTLGRCVIKILEPTAGEILLDVGEPEMIDVSRMKEKDFRKYRKNLHMIFQDPYSSLNPRMTVGQIIAEPLMENNKGMNEKEIEEKVKNLMELVGLSPSHLKRYPHAFSGGQRQRIGIARSLANEPKLIICDEAVSALDVSIQAQVLNLLQDLQDKFGIAYLFISHNLSVVQHISNRLAVMYVGKMVELGNAEDVFAKPFHPYTEALLSAVPEPDPERKRNRIVLEGEIANPANPPSGCPFHPRCKYCTEKCTTKVPEWREVEPGRFVSCHRADGLKLKGAM